MTVNSGIQVVNNEFYSAWFAPEYKMIHHMWKRYTTGETWRSNMTAAADAFEQYHCDRWLSDDRRFLGTLSQEDWAWGDVNFSKRCRDLGWKYFAMVLPKSGMAKVSIRAVCNAFSAHGVETEAFTEYRKAFFGIMGK